MKSTVNLHLRITYWPQSRHFHSYWFSTEGFVHISFIAGFKEHFVPKNNVCMWWQYFLIYRVMRIQMPLSKNFEHLTCLRNETRFFWSNVQISGNVRKWYIFIKILPHLRIKNECCGKLVIQRNDCLNINNQRFSDDISHTFLPY